jgi:hypothetical protein
MRLFFIINYSVTRSLSESVQDGPNSEKHVQGIHIQAWDPTENIDVSGWYSRDGALDRYLD